MTTTKMMIMMVETGVAVAATVVVRLYKCHILRHQSHKSLPNAEINFPPF